MGYCKKKRNWKWGEIFYYGEYELVWHWKNEVILVRTKKDGKQVRGYLSSRLLSKADFEGKDGTRF